MWWWLSCAPEPTLDGACELDEDNALRVRCRFESDPPAPLALTLAPADGGEVVARSSPAGAEHDVIAWRLRPDTPYRWTARVDGASVSGEVTTERLPPAATLAVTHQGEPRRDDVMFLVDCDGPTAVTLDPDGQVVWYQELAADLPPPHHAVGLTWTEEGTVLAVVDRARIREYALDGTLVREIAAQPGMGEVVHHDVFRRDGVTYALSARSMTVDGVEYVVDGLYAYDSAGERLFAWDLSELATPSGPGGLGAVYWTDLFPGALDWAHENGLYVDADGDWIVSLHSFSTVMRVEGDPADPGFGAPVWVLDGSGTSPWPSDFAVTDPDGRTDDEVFGHQHHPSLLADGSLLLFDNGDVVAGEARVLQLGLDVDAGEAAIRGSWPVPAVCPIEGGAFVLPDGDILATCALQSTFYVLAAEDGRVRGSETARCAGSAGLALLPRAIPVPR